MEFPRLLQKTSDWEVTVVFSRPVFHLEAFNGKAIRVSKFQYKIKPADWNADLGCKPLKLELKTSKSQKFCNPNAVAYINLTAGMVCGKALFSPPLASMHLAYKCEFKQCEIKLNLFTILVRVTEMYFRNRRHNLIFKGKKA